MQALLENPIDSLKLNESKIHQLAFAKLIDRVSPYEEMMRIHREAKAIPIAQDRVKFLCGTAQVEGRSVTKIGAYVNNNLLHAVAEAYKNSSTPHNEGVENMEAEFQRGAFASAMRKLYVSDVQIESIVAAPMANSEVRDSFAEALARLRNEDDDVAIVVAGLADKARVAKGSDPDGIMRPLVSTLTGEAISDLRPFREKFAPTRFSEIREILAHDFYKYSNGFT